MTTVTLLQRFAIHGGPRYNVGECVGLDDALAGTLIAAGIAVRAYDAPPVDRMIETAPVKRDLASPPRKGRFHAK